MQNVQVYAKPHHHHHQNKTKKYPHDSETSLDMDVWRHIHEVAWKHMEEITKWK